MSDPQKSIIEVDADVHRIAEVMQREIAASRLVAVADGLAAIAPLLWGSYQPEPVQTIRLVSEPIAGPRRLGVASE
jgi:hypothetical protein